MEVGYTDGLPLYTLCHEATSKLVCGLPQGKDYPRCLEPDMICTKIFDKELSP